MSYPRKTSADVIGRLVDDQLASGEGRRNPDLGRCLLCGGDWHGAPIDTYDVLGGYWILGCPGAFACESQREGWTNSWAYAVLRREGVVDVPTARIDDNDLLAHPLPQNMCPWCGDEVHDYPVGGATEFDADKLPPCPGSSATIEQHQEWLWQCRFRVYCEAVMHEKALRYLGFYDHLATRSDEVLPCCEMFDAAADWTD